MSCWAHSWSSDGRRRREGGLTVSQSFLVNLEMSGLEASCLETEIGVDKSAVRLAISDCLQTFY